MPHKPASPATNSTHVDVHRAAFRRRKAASSKQVALGKRWTCPVPAVRLQSQPV